MLRKTYIRRYNFILGLSETLGQEVYSLIELRQKAIKTQNLQALDDINKTISCMLENIELSSDDGKEALSLRENIDMLKKKYNLSVVAFNKQVFNRRNGFVARMCKVNKLEEIL